MTAARVASAAALTSVEQIERERASWPNSPVEPAPLGSALAVLRAGEFQVLREEDDLIITAAGGRV